MTDTEVERALGYTPCICGVLNGTWHSKCYEGKTSKEIRVGYKNAFANARKHLKQQANDAAAKALYKSPMEPGKKE
jgi:hypothetical protein